MFQDFLTNIYYNNTGKEYLLTILIFIGILVVLKMFEIFKKENIQFAYPTSVEYQKKI